MAKPRVPKKTDGNVTTPMGASSTQEVAETNLNGSVVNKGARKRESVRPEIVKTESRANLVPINLENEIRQLAYLLSERRGFEPGHETDDWVAAEREVLQRYHQQSA